MSNLEFPSGSNAEPYAENAGNSCSDLGDYASPTKPTDGSAVLGSGDTDTTMNVHIPRNKFSTFLNHIVPHGGTISNVYNLSAVTLGSGIISLPSSFQATGIITAVLCLVAISLFTVYSTYALIKAADKTGNRLYSFEALSRGLLGRGWDYLAAFNMWMFCFGSCVSYVISVGDLLKSATDGDSVNAFIRSTWGNRVLVIMIWAVVMLPLSIPKEVNSLRYFSIVGVTCMMYFVVVIIVHSCMNGFEDGKPINKVYMFKSGNSALVGFSNFLFCFLSQTNIWNVGEEAIDPSPKGLTRDTAISTTLCCVLYILSGLFGYFDFGEQITDSILLYYNVRSDVLVAIAYVGIGVKMCVGFAICMQPSRDAIYHLLGNRWPMFNNVKTVPFWIHALICTFLSVLALVLGLFIPSVNIVFGLVGSFCGGFLGFIYPALFIMYAGNWGLKQVGWFHYLATYLMLVAGVIAVVFGTVAAVYGII